jgi:hypothetical protein
MVVVVVVRHVVVVMDVSSSCQWPVTWKTAFVVVVVICSVDAYVTSSS